MNFKNKLATAALISLAVLSISSYSQDENVRPDTYNFEEIVVTAQRRSESILDVPLAITAKTGEQLQQAGVTSTTDLVAVVPNLQINSSFGNTQPNFSLRGVSVANEYNANQASPVGVYVDDAYLAARTSHGMQLFDLERVEVLRGPQGTLYGRNTTGGAINFLSKFPALEGSEGYARVGFGNFGHQEAQGAFETTFGGGTSGLRLAINYRENDGVIKNTSGADTLGTDSLSARLTYRIKPADELDIRVKVYTGGDEGGQAGVHAIGTGSGGANPISGYVRPATLDFFEVEQERVGSNDVDGAGVYLRVDYDLNEQWTLSSITSYDDASQNLGQDADGSSFDLLFISWNSDFEQFNQELRLAYSSDAVNVQGGIYYGSDEITTSNLFEFFRFVNTLGGAPCDPVTLAACDVRQRYTQERDSIALFAQTDWYLSEDLTLTVGLRWTDDNTDYIGGNAFIQDHNDVFVASTIPAVLADGVTPAGPNDVLPTRSESLDEVTGRVALAWDFTEDNLAYLSYSRGYRSGAFNGGGYLSPVQIDFAEPEFVDAYELGFKGVVFNGSTRYDLAAFYYDYEDQQVQEVVGVVAFIRNSGESTIQGIELETETIINDKLSITAALGLLDTEYEDLALSAVNLAGNELPFAPETTAKLGLNWQAYRAGDASLSVNFNVDYSDQIWFSPFNELNGNQNLQEGSSVKINLSTRYQHGPYNVLLWGKNITNEEAFGYGLDLRALGYDFLIPTVGATYGITVGYNF